MTIRKRARAAAMAILLGMSLAPAAQADQVITQVSIAAPRAQLRWLGSLPGLFSGEHYWILRDRPDGGTDLEQGEVFKGVMVPFIKPERLRVDYEAMNKAMKARAESAP
jgi:hypothetical protein